MFRLAITPRPAERLYRQEPPPSSIRTLTVGAGFAPARVAFKPRRSGLDLEVALLIFSRLTAGREFHPAPKDISLQ